MKCPKCKEEMNLEEYYNYYRSEKELEVEEHWWCGFCDGTFTRYAVFTQTEERWEEE